MSGKNFMVVVLGCFLNSSFAFDYFHDSFDVKSMYRNDFERKQHYKQMATERRMNDIKERCIFLDQDDLLPSIAGDKELFYGIFNDLEHYGPQRLSAVKDRANAINELFRRITDDSSVEKIASHNRKHTKQLTHQVSGWDFVQTQMPWQWKQIVLSARKSIKNFYGKFNPIITAIEYDGMSAIQLSATMTRKEFINDVQGVYNVEIKNEWQILNLVLSIRYDDQKGEIHISHFFPNESKRKAIMHL